MAADKPASDDSVIDDALLDEDSMLGDEDSSGAGSSLEDGANPVDLTSLPTLPSVIKGSPEKKLETVKRAASISPTKKVVSQTNGSTEVLGSPPAKKKITINRQPLPTVATALITAPVPGTGETKDGEKQVIKISVAATAEDKAKLRQDKFGATNITETAAPANKTSASSITANPFLDERMKKRAERFGPGTVTSTPTATGKVSLTTEDDVKLAKRKERFGAGLIKPAEERKEQRAARFGADSIAIATTTTTTITVSSDISPITVAPAGDSDDKKKNRAARFGAAPRREE